MSNQTDLILGTKIKVESLSINGEKRKKILLVKPSITE